MTTSGSRIASGLTESGLQVIGAYLAHNAVPAAQLPVLIREIHAVMARIARGVPEQRDEEAPFEKPTPAAIRRSVTPTGLISFIDGKPYKTLKRHLTAYGLTPLGYRERYGLPADYPLVSPDYAQRRSNLAKAIGLGRPGALAARDAQRRRSA